MFICLASITGYAIDARNGQHVYFSVGKYCFQGGHIWILKVKEEAEKAQHLAGVEPSTPCLIDPCSTTDPLPTASIYAFITV